jgi:hypothetical protein
MWRYSLFWKIGSRTPAADRAQTRDRHPTAVPSSESVVPSNWSVTEASANKERDRFGRKLRRRLFDDNRFN